MFSTDFALIIINYLIYDYYCYVLDCQFQAGGGAGQGREGDTAIFVLN